ncbi:hypothetical protein, partial [Campylobacter jejuni]
NFLCGNSISFPKILFSCKTSFGKITISPEQAVSDEYNSPFVGTHISVIFIFSFRSVYKELHADRETGCGASCTPFAPAGKQAEFLRMGMSKKSACFQRTAAGI